MQWIRKPQEQEGTYQFSGQLYVTRAVINNLIPEEILAIYLDVKAFVLENNGADYLQVYENEDGDKLLFIDQLNSEMIASGEFRPEENHCTLLFSSEY